ncbi:MAG: AMP-binding protein, partial [Acidobacteria bacterium]|nr:AMP-binding protein [Acidobacteriota bacterium]
DSGALAPQIEYWKKRLAGAPQALDLPTRGPRPENQTYNGRLFRFAVDREVTDGLLELVRETSSTLFCVLQAAYAEVLGRFAGEREVLVGTPAARRPRPELEPLIGLFVNTLVLRNDLDGADTVRQRVLAVRETVFGAFDHQDLPFEELVNALRVVRDPSRSPLFQVLFALHNVPVDEPVWPGLRTALRAAEITTAKLDLSLNLMEVEDGLRCALEYNTDLFTADTVERLSRHWVGLLRAFALRRDERIASLSLLDAAERSQLLAEGRARQEGTEGELAPRREAHLAFEAQAVRRPEAPALTCQGKTLSYGELNRRANRLAHLLRRHGVGPEVPVGVALERTPELVVALLAVLKAGGAYVPLDPALPVQRLETMCAAAAVPLLLTSTDLGLFAGEGNLPCRRLDVDLLGKELESLPEENPDSAHLPVDRLAYAIFTSGSTGLPKGVEVSHRGLANFLHSMVGRPGLREDDVLAAVTTISFDIAALEIFGPLAVGGRVVLADWETAVDGARLLALLRNEKITVLQATPATWKLLLAAGWEEPLPLTMLCGGEALPPDLAGRLLERGRALWNLYGPT